MRHHREKERFLIAIKANRVLQSVLIALVIILIRLWHLSVIQHDTLTEEAHKPRKRSVISTPARATIRDRFNIPLAYNKIDYNLSLIYAHIQEIPASAYKTDEKGNQIKYFKRKEYIHSLSELIAKELEIDAARLEDEIHSTAVFFGLRPYVIKENISEKQFYRLKMLEKDYPGLLAQIVPKRHYPLGRVGSHLVGYVGPIERSEYIAVSQEINALKSFIEKDEEGETQELPAGVASNKEARERVKELQERAYQINDYVGKTGIESQFEEELRGYRGTQSYLTDAKGNVLRELPQSREAIPGERVLLTISSELQAFAENLLIQNEKIRDQRIGRNEEKVIDQPWIKGGAIVVMEPKSGEVLALASYPRFDPNDFTHQGETLARSRWLEDEKYIASIWDGQADLLREGSKKDENLTLNWKQYLHFIAPVNSSLYKVINRVQTLNDAVNIQRILKPFEKSIPSLINYLYPQDTLFPDGMGKVERELLFEKLDTSFLRTFLDPYLKEIKHNKDKLLGLDVTRLVADEERFSERLLKQVGSISLETFRSHSTAFVSIEDFVRSEAQQIFHHTDFKKWREESQSSFLKEKREQEKQLKIYAKPYLEYIDQEERKQFKLFWQESGWSLILTFLKGSRGDRKLETYQRHFHSWHSEIALGAHGTARWRKAYDTLSNCLEGFDTPSSREYLQALRRFDHLHRPLWGRYRHIREEKNIQLEKHLAMGFYPKFGFGCCRAQAFRQSSSQGSVFKLITAYSILKQRYHEIAGAKLHFSLLNPLTIDEQRIVNGKNVYLARLENGTLIPQLYKKGRLCTSVIKNIGKIDIIGALEHSSNPYFSLLASDCLHHPNDLSKAALEFGYSSKTGILLPGEASGNLPHDLETNPTGLFSFAIGQHTLVCTPLQTAVMTASLANYGTLIVPKIVNVTVGSYPDYAGARSYSQAFAFEESLQTAGITFPLFLAPGKASTKPILNQYSILKKESIDLPHPIRNTILEGMRQVVDNGQVGGMWGLRHYFGENQEPINSFIRLRHDLVGKTGTAECVEVLNLDQETGTKKCCQIWFAGISFDHELLPQDRAKVCTEEDLFGEAELVVVVYLRHGGYGKDTAPLAAQVIEKWREIRDRNGK